MAEFLDPHAAVAVGIIDLNNRLCLVETQLLLVSRHRLDDPWDLVVIARSGAPDLGLADVEGQFDALIQYLNRRSRKARS